MTIKELNDFMYHHGFCNTYNEEDLPKKYVCDLVESALKEGYAKAIDEFAERVKPIIDEKIKGWTNSDDLRRWCERAVDTVAEQLKGNEE